MNESTAYDLEHSTSPYCWKCGQYYQGCTHVCNPLLNQSQWYTQITIVKCPICNGMGEVREKDVNLRRPKSNKILTCPTCDDYRTISR